MSWIAIVAFAALALGPGRAKADADPALGYFFASYAVPWHVSTSASKPRLVGGDWTTTEEIGPRTGEFAYTRDAVGFGAGIGYDGFNVQLDVRSLGESRSGELTFGYRLNLQLGNIEGWTRVAAGPAVALDYRNKQVERAAGGLSTVAEVGLDYFFWKETMAIGAKAVANPHYTWPATFVADFDVNVGLRFIL